MSEYFDNKDLFLEPKVKQYGSHMVMTNVNKPTKHKYFNIDTRFRDDYDEYSNPKQTVSNITLPQRINDVKSINVCSAEIPLSYYNISASLGNNAFQIIKSDNTAKTIVIKDGYYNSTSLVTQINAEMLVATFSEIEFSINNKCSITINNNNYTFNFAIRTSMTTTGDSQNDDIDKFNFKSKLGWLLGFRNISYNSGTTLTSEAFVDLNGPRYLYLVFDEYNNGNQNSFISPLYTSILNKNILAKIIVDNNHYEFGKILTANNFNGYLLTDRRCYNGKIDLQRLKIQLVNEIGLPIDLNGLDFSFTLEIEYE